MANSLKPPPYQIPLTDRSGLISNIWNQWIRELYVRVGGTIAPSLSEISNERQILENQMADLQAEVTVLRNEVSQFSGIGIGRQL